MLRINERPNITSAISTDDGYMVRTLCLVDGFPAEVEIEIDTHRQKYSRFHLSLYDPVEVRWKHIADLKSQEVGRMPILHDEPETIVELNRVAGILWDMASLIVRTGRERQEEIEAADYVRNRMALQAALDRRIVIRPDQIAENRAAAKAFALANDGQPYQHSLREEDPDPRASGDHDAAEFAADASDEERQG